ncbi:MAG: TIGR00297 family protein [Methanomicrobiales archaeon]|nr:TIGR00297 family protein [Methanomicrobiales archaeon]
MMDRWAAAVFTGYSALLIVLAFGLPQPWVFALGAIAGAVVLFSISRQYAYILTIFVLAGLYGAGLIDLMIFSASLAIVAVGEVSIMRPDPGLTEYIIFIVTATIVASAIMVVLGRNEPLIIIFGVMVAVLLKEIQVGREGAAPVVALGTSMTMFLFADINYQADLTLIAAAVLIAFCFAYFSYRFKAADLSGLFSGAIVGVLLLVFAGPKFFLIMLTFFIIGSACTKFRYREKEKMGVEQTQGGARGYRNVFSNGMVSAAAAVLFGVTQQPAFAAMFVGSVASAAADTVASEIGVMCGKPFLITTFERVAPGTNGGVTIGGELAALLTSAAISGTALAFGVISPGTTIVCIIAGFVGTNADSLVGAVIENRGIIGNAGTNVIGTLSGGIFALLVSARFL